MYRKGTKIIASMLVFMMALSNVSVIGQAVYASSLESQEKATNNANVEFDAYFVANEKRTHSQVANIKDANTLYAEINVKNAGYLKNATIEAKDSNFEISESIESEQVAKVENNSIALNQIKNGETIEIAIPIQIKQNTSINVSELSKENKVKLTGTYVDGKGKEKQIEKDIMVNLGWTAAKEQELNMQVSKFVPYTIGEQKGLVLQTTVQSYLKNNTLPVKENKIEISVPNINGIKPQEIKVTANTTKATNGDETGINFSKENYLYDEENSLLTIKVENIANENGKISWQKNAQDEFVITYIYPEEAQNNIGEEGIKVLVEANSELTIYEANETKAQKTFSGEVTLKDQISNLLDFTIETQTKDLSKGQIYANYNASKKLETEYQETIIANIGLAQLTDKIILEQQADNFVTEANAKTIATNGVYYKTLNVSKENFDKILGEEGYIKIYTGETLISTIDKSIEVNDEGKIVVSLAEYNISSIKIETSKPIIEGKISFDITKAIKTELPYAKAQMREYSKLQLNLTGKAINGETEFTNQIVTKEIPFVEPTSQAELTINNTNLSTVVKNENVKITAVLKTDTVYTSLYQNPTLKITMPSYVENINIKNIEVLFDTEGSKLTLKGHEILQNANGTKTIVINLEGTQTEYTLGAVSKGVNVVITSDIIVNKLTPNKQEQISMVYTNSNIITKARSAVEEKEVSTQINFVAPTGVITTTTISNYVEGASELTSISGEEKIATIATMAEARNATFNMSVINNYNNTIDNISILGRTLFEGNKDIVTGKDLETTMNIPLTSNIIVTNVDASKVAVYYSENTAATKDLNNTANGWTLTPANLANVKSYLIVITDYAMNTGESINFSYQAQIPANLQHNEEAYETYVVYFNNNLETGKVEDKEVATKLGVTTGAGPVLEATIKSNIPENEELLEGKLIKYTITLKNTGKGEAQNVIASYEVPNCLSQVIPDETSSLGYKIISNTERTIKIENVPVGGTINTEVWFRVSNLTTADICEDETHYIENEFTGKVHNSEYTHSYEEYKCEVNLSVDITADKQLENVNATSNNNIVKKSFYTTQTMYRSENSEYAKEGEEIKYTINVSSKDADEERKNTIVKINIPDELVKKQVKVMQFLEEKGYVEQEAKVEYNDKTRELTIEIGNVDGYYGKRVEITSIVNKLNTSEYEKEIELQARIQGDNTSEETTEKTIIKLAKYALKVNQVASITENSDISAAEDFKYTITIENPSPITISGVKVKDYLPAELEYVYSVITDSTGFETTNTEVDENGNPEMTVIIPGKSTIKIEVYVVVKPIENNTKITNKVAIEHDVLGKIEANAVSHTIEKFENIYEETEEVKKRIVGTVWNDKNTNGIIDTEETKMSNVEVILFNNQSGEVMLDQEGNIITVKTSEDGTYTFDNITQGNYTVIFLYDTANYSATTYKVQGASEEVNSDAVDTDITIYGETKIAAITEEIRVTDSNVYNINLGLVENPKFDLKLEKTVSKITVQDSTGTNVYNYEGTKLAKKDLVGKEINNTTIIVEYKIKVINEGAISGYVKKIADYIPSEMKFNSELNTDWYVAENGTLYNSSLANTLINPGESKEVTLLLTKKMTEENLGLYNNTAEIYEAYNDLGIEDIDSIEGNKVSSEDDMSSADVLITVKTGETILFVGLTITIITTIGVGAYFIKKKVLR